MVVPCAQLRVFVPVEALSPRDRARWAPEAALGHGQARQAEDDVARLRLLLGRGHLPDGAALVRRIGDERFVCPLQYDLRAAAGLRLLSHEVPGPVVDLLVPAGDVRRRAAAADRAGGTPTIVDAPWAVPLPWFVLVNDEERRFLDPPEAAAPRLLYVTRVGTALERLDRALDAMDVVEDAIELLDELAELADWLESFDESSLLELDYAGLPRVLDRAWLAADHSARDLWDAIEGLEAGDLLAAVAAYGVLRARWGALRAQPTAS